MTLGSIQVSLARHPAEKTLADQIVVEHHSYVASASTVGRCLKYLIWTDSEPLGTIWIGSAMKPTPKALLEFFGLSQSAFDECFNTIADNKRFCLAKHIPNLGSFVLARIRRRVRADWLTNYGDELAAIFTTVGPSHSGSVYLADNWSFVGETSGLPSNRKALSMKWNAREEIRQRFVQPTGEDRKKIFATKAIGNKQDFSTWQERGFGQFDLFPNSHADGVEETTPANQQGSAGAMPALRSASHKPLRAADE